MTGPLDSANQSGSCADAEGGPLPAEDALESAAALRHERRAAELVAPAA
jgi:hypothetical protein